MTGRIFSLSHQVAKTQAGDDQGEREMVRSLRDGRAMAEATDLSGAGDAARRPGRLAPVLGWMAAAIVGVAALAYWDEKRESDAALDDLASEQVSVARAVSVAISGAPQAASATPEERFAAARSVEAPGSLVVLLRSPDGALITTSGARVASSALDSAPPSATFVRLERPQAAEIGLPARTAMAGIVPLERPYSNWSVVVAATARRERDRQFRARYRLLLGVGVASGLVIAFGGLALRKQRKGLELHNELAVAAAREERNERLIRADKLATMGALATGVAHELSTPLGVIVGRAEQLQARLDPADEKSRRAASDILAQSERIDRVMRGFLGLARGAAPALEKTAPADVARHATELVAHRFAKAGVELASRLDEPAPSISCAPQLLEQAVVNLLLNACDACEKGGRVELSVVAERQRVGFVVTDDGEGITPERAERATEPFFTTKPEGKGTGLGLAIANEIVKHHRGDALARAARGPRRHARLHRDSGGARGDVMSSVIAKETPPRVLVVDDHHLHGRDARRRARRSRLRRRRPSGPARRPTRASPRESLRRPGHRPSHARHRRPRRSSRRRAKAAARAAGHRDDGASARSTRRSSPSAAARTTT